MGVPPMNHEKDAPDRLLEPAVSAGSLLAFPSPTGRGRPAPVCLASLSTLNVLVAMTRLTTKMRPFILFYPAG